MWHRRPPSKGARENLLGKHTKKKPKQILTIWCGKVGCENENRCNEISKREVGE